MKTKLSLVVMMYLNVIVLTDSYLQKEAAVALVLYREKLLAAVPKLEGMAEVA